MKLVRLLSKRLSLRGQSCLHIRAHGYIKQTLCPPLPHDAVKLTRLSQPQRPLQRTLSLHLRTFSTPPTTLIDPSRPSLFYHLFPPPNPISKALPAYAVSLFEQPPKDAQSAAIMGWLPAAGSNEAGGEAGLDDFKENRE